MHVVTQVTQNFERTPMLHGDLCDPLSKLTQLTALKLGDDIRDRELKCIR